MKFLNKKMFALVALLSVTGYSFGYEFGVSNLTEKPLVVRLKEKALSDAQYKLIQPNDRGTFGFWGAYCLESIMVAPYDAAKGNNFGSYALQSVETYMEPKEVYEATVKGAKSLVAGIEAFACQALDLAMKADPAAAAASGAKEALATAAPGTDKAKKCAFGLATIAKASGKLAGNTLCKSREISIISTGEKTFKMIGTRKIPLSTDEYIALTVTGE